MMKVNHRGFSPALIPVCIAQLIQVDLLWRQLRLTQIQMSPV